MNVNAQCKLQTYYVHVIVLILHNKRSLLHIVNRKLTVISKTTTDNNGVKHCIAHMWHTDVILIISMIRIQMKTGNDSDNDN